MSGPLAFASKGGTLAGLAGRLSGAAIPPLLLVAVADWRAGREGVLDAVAAEPWGAGELAVRSSARDEDAAGGSRAGAYRSLLRVVGRAALAEAIDAVIASYGRDGRAIDPADAVLIQRQVADVARAGVAFGRDPSTGGPYITIDWSEGAATDAVTGGRADGLQRHVHHRAAPRVPAGVAVIVALVEELAALFGDDRLDVEFAEDAHGRLHLLQVRPLAVAAPAPPAAAHAPLVAAIAAKLERAMAPHPYLRGRRGVFGVMPDWNPAEIIGVRPRPLALSLYRELVTDAIWAYQRHNYGYRNLRSFPLLLSLGGQPYVDVRVSFNSFVPADLGDGLADRLVNYYVDRLVAQPVLHDKVEFEILFSCYSLDLPARLAGLAAHGFALDDRARLADSLRRLTNRVIGRDTGLWRGDRAKLKELETRRRTVLGSELDPLAKVYWLVEDCKRYGTLPFAGLARAGFIAVQLLRSLVAIGVLGDRDYQRFMAGLDTVGGAMARDLARLPRADFLAEYGHLRPGTYDILSPRYDAAPERYFQGPPAPPPRREEPFTLSLDALRRLEAVLADHGLDQDVVGLFDFIEAGIAGRERAKFVFTRNLSAALELIAGLGAAAGFDRDAMSYVDYADLRALYADSGAAAPALAASIARGRARHAETLGLNLPPLITAPEQVWSFGLPRDEANFITLGRAEGAVAPADPALDLAGRIVLAPSADPGFDWLFARGIAGFVTAFGGANSHMAIRAGELGLPAAIGVGEARLADLARARRLDLDCANRRIQVLA